MTPSSEENSYFKEGGDLEVSEEPKQYHTGVSEEPKQYQNGISSIVSLLPTKNLANNGQQIIQNVPKKRRVREPGMINDLNPRRPETDIESVPPVTMNRQQSISQPKKITKLTDQQKQDFERKRFEREERGQFTLIFPFNSLSE